MQFYTTITTKGQITLPAAFRQKLHLKAGQQVTVTRNNKNQLIIESPPDMAAVQAELQAILKSRGISKRQLRAMAEAYQNGDGFAAHVKANYGKQS